jgi:hypothetical protein
MLETYQGILREDRIEWSGAAPQLPPEQAVRVEVTLLDNVPRAAPGAGRGARMAAALEALAALPTRTDVPDPAAWEREARQDRPLPGRDE